MAGRPETYRFGEYTLEAGEHRLLRNSAEVTLRPKVFDTLLYLVTRHGHTVGKNELLDAVWPGTFVTEAVLTHCIAEIRQALQDDPHAPRYLKTIPKVGYAFIAEVHATGGLAEAGPFLREVPERRPASTIAVLPFVNLSPDPQNEYLCDGLSEELINGLTKVPELRVVAHSSSFSFKGRDIDAREIGRQLGAGSILEGSVRKAGDRLRISAQLIDTAGGFHVWCEQYDRSLSDVFALQDEISRSVLGALKVELCRPGHRAIVTPSTRNIEAYLLYLQGRFFWHRRFAGQLRLAMECFEKAMQLDPGLALAYAGLADAFGTLGVWAFSPPREVMPKAAALVRKALELDPALAEAHASQGLIHAFYDWAWRPAEQELARAVELNPGSALTHLWAGHYLSIVGRFDEAIAEVEHARALDPLSPIVSANVGWTYYLARQPGRAIREVLGVLERHPGNPIALLYLGFVYAELGRLADAMSCFRESAATPGGLPWAAESVGWVYGLLGKPDQAHAVLGESLSRMSTAYVPSSAIACIHLGLGDDDALFEWLGRCIEERDALLPWLKVMPAFDRVRSDPRFQALLAGLGLA